MKDTIVQLVGNKLEKLDVWIDDAYTDKEGSITYLHIVLNSKKIIPINTVVMATRIINPLLDTIDIIEESYILDIYAKEKGDGKDE